MFHSLLLVCLFVSEVSVIMIRGSMNKVNPKDAGKLKWPYVHGRHFIEGRVRSIMSQFCIQTLNHWMIKSYSEISSCDIQVYIFPTTLNFDPSLITLVKYPSHFNLLVTMEKNRLWIYFNNSNNRYYFICKNILHMRTCVPEASIKGRDK